MATKIYAGVNDKACKVKRIYIGVSGKARSVKKAYIGVNGKARLCWIKAGLYYCTGKMPELSVGRSGLAAAASYNHALFGGGSSAYSTGKLNIVDGFNNKLTKIDVAPLNSKRTNLTATFHRAYAGVIFCGGFDESKVSGIVDVYNRNLVKTTASKLSVDRCALASATNAYNAIIAGGYKANIESNTVDSYDASLTKSSISNLSQRRHHLSGSGTADNSGIVLFGGGEYSYKYADDVDGYSVLSTKYSVASLSIGRSKLASAPIGKYIIFAGGYNKGDLTDVDLYDKSFTKVSTIAPMSIGRSLFSATRVGNYVIFSGGYNREDLRIADIYDIDLVRTTMTVSFNARGSVAASIGNYAIFAGGDIIESPDDEEEIPNPEQPSKMNVFNLID